MEVLINFLNENQHLVDVKTCFIKTTMVQDYMTWSGIPQMSNLSTLCSKVVYPNFDMYKTSSCHKGYALRKNYAASSLIIN